MPARSLPPKLYFRIGEVASLVGVEPHVLRYWEREFRSIRPTKSSKGQRVYSRRDVENLMKVRDLLYDDGFTIAGAKRRMQRVGIEPERRSLVASEEAAETDAGEVMATDDPEGAGTDAEAHTLFRETLLALRTEIATFLDELGEGAA